jgi:hypothetical protein
MSNNNSILGTLKLFYIIITSIATCFLIGLLILASNDQFILGSDNVAAYKAKRAELEKQAAVAPINGLKLLSGYTFKNGVFYPAVFEYTDPANGARSLVFTGYDSITALPADAPLPEVDVKITEVPLDNPVDTNADHTY